MYETARIVSTRTHNPRAQTYLKFGFGDIWTASKVMNNMMLKCNVDRKETVKLKSFKPSEVKVQLWQKGMIGMDTIIAQAHIRFDNLINARICSHELKDISGQSVGSISMAIYWSPAITSTIVGISSSPRPPQRLANMA